mmetsp:Transcript_10968/g.20047  ORF Transcript_10968/g.20047 Transcript_10968/m.20047 type:complete len:642 (-) Transcript_10968:203-2128(-)
MHTGSLRGRAMAESTDASLRVYSLFSIVPYQVHLRLPTNSVSQSQLSMAAIGDELKAINIAFLTDRFGEALAEAAVEQTEFHSVELEMDLHLIPQVKQKSMGNREYIHGIVAEFYGQVVFTRSKGTTTLNREWAQSIAYSAFQGESLNKYAVRHYGSTIYPLSSLVSVNVFTDYEGIDLTNQVGNTNKERPYGSGDTKMTSGEIVVAFFVGLLMFVFVGLLYLFASSEYRLRKYERYHKHHEWGPAMNYFPDPQTSNNNMEEGDFLFNSEEEKDQVRSLRFMSMMHPTLSENGDDGVVPIPVHNISGMNKKRSNNLDGDMPVARRYVEPASPFDVIYGAAFFHEEQPQVREQYSRHTKSSQLKKKRPSNKLKHSSTKKKKFMRPINPMMSITEEDLTAPPGTLRHNAEERDMSRPSPSFANVVKSFASLLPSRSFEQKYPEESITFEHELQDPDLISPRGVDEIPFAFKDFPRHDGTPCLIYPDSNNNDEKSGDVVDMTLVVEGSSHTVDSDLDESVTESSLDGFLEKLETLVAAQSRQYQERVKMDKEKELRRKAREEKRKRGKTVTSEEKINGKDTVDELLTAATTNSQAQVSDPASVGKDGIHGAPVVETRTSAKDQIASYSISDDMNEYAVTLPPLS